MSVNFVKKKITHGVNKWDVLVADSEMQLTAAKNRVIGLEKAVKNFKQLRDSGMPWPEEKAGTAAEPIPAKS